MVACIRCELHIVDNLKANILIGNNIIGAEGITIDIAKEKIYIPGCKATIPITTRQRGQFVKKILHLTTYVTVLLQSQAFVSKNLLFLPLDRNFYFEPMQQPKLSLFAHLVIYNTKGILV